MQQFISSIILTVCFLSFSVRADEKKKTDSLNTASNYSRLCQEDELYGLWKVVRWIPYFEIYGKDWEKPIFMHNQWFLFDGKGGVKSLSSNLDIKIEDVKKRLYEMPIEFSIRFKKKGFMNIKDKQKDIPEENWRCAISEKDFFIKSMNIELKKDDLIMTMLGKGNSILYFRQLRRVEK